VTLALLLVASLALAQDRLREDERHLREAPHTEGALDNDVFVAVVEAEVLQSLQQGDQALERARAAAQASERERQLDLAFDGWRGALARAPAGARLWLAPAAGEVRTAEGLHAGLLRRILGLSREERARFVGRFATASGSALTEARLAPVEAREGALAEVVRLVPASAAGARAALELADRAREAGAPARARAWLARAELEADLAGAAELGAASKRRALPSPAPTSEGWQAALSCVPAGAFAFEARALAGAQAERRQRPGAAFLGPGRFVVQTPQELLCFAPRADGPLKPYARVSPVDLLEGALLDLTGEAPREAPGWPLRPLVDGGGVVLVLGRALEEDSNALVVLDLEPPSDTFGLGLDLGQSRAAARLRWALVGARWTGPEGTFELPALEALAPFEFQPGPVLAADRVVVQLRSGSAPLESWLLALERSTGRVAWLRPLARGADRVTTGRLSRASRRVAGQPLCAFETEGEARVFVGTHLGLGVLVDALDGEPLWSFKNRRRPEHEAGWSGDRPHYTTGGTEGVLLWAPMDSDRLYTLSAARVADDTGQVEARSPAPLSEAQTLLGGGLDEHVVAGGRGKERTVSLRRSGQDRIDALDLGEEEFFRSQGLVGDRRVWIASDRELYLFDRERELYLLDNQPLAPAGPTPPGGDIVASGSEVLVVGLGAVWRFTTR
jgi:hypothetical protein